MASSVSPPDRVAAGQRPLPGVGVERKLRLIGTHLLSALQEASDLKSMALKVLLFIPGLFERPIYFCSVVLEEGGEQRRVLAGTSPEVVSLDELRLHTPETLGGYALRSGAVLYVPDVDKDTAVTMPLTEIRKIAAGHPPAIHQNTLSALIPTQEAGAVTVFRDKGIRSLLFTPLAASERQKVFLAVGFSTLNHAFTPQEVVLAAAALFPVFSTVAYSRFLR